ncbi:hypothetical protein EU245_14795 [Lentibacillus lipolyticus]|nr:hypothetical protein EU245_14795 [Lentibacillus lipolyticus]
MMKRQKTGLRNMQNGMKGSVISMFDSTAPCYMTSEVDRRVPQSILAIILEMLFALDLERGEQTDYLQVFEVLVDSKNERVIIKNRQEQTPLQKTMVFEQHIKLEESFTIWAMWQEDHTILLFPSDY